MNLTRKEFFRRGFFSLGETLLRAGVAAREAQESFAAAPDFPAPDQPAAASEPAPGPHLVARVDHGHCLAGSCGCFSCLDCCEAGAISLVPGVGIGIDAALCDGCGACHALCPLAPQALALVPRAPGSAAVSSR